MDGFEDGIGQNQSFTDQRSMEGMEPMGYSPDHYNQNVQQPMVPLAHLNYEKIKLFIFHSQEEPKVCASLHALRARILKSRPGLQRKQVLFAYIHYNILGCDQEKNNLIDLFNSSQKIVEYTMMLVETLVTESIGKSYILKQEGLIQKIIEFLKRENGETTLRQYSLGTLQKISLGRPAQAKMIENDVIKWAVNLLKNELNSLTEYSLEYVTALLMNLSLRTAGKKKFEELDIEILKVLNELLEHENNQVRTYVNGTLYSILESKKLKQEAKALNMGEVLQYLLKNSEERFKRQIQYILSQLESNKEEDDIASTASDDEDGNEIEYDEESDDEYDEEDEYYDEKAELTDAVPGVPNGEDWLMSEFIANNDEALQQNEQI